MSSNVHILWYIFTFNLETFDKRLTKLLQHINLFEVYKGEHAMLCTASAQFAKLDNPPGQLSSSQLLRLIFLTVKRVMHHWTGGGGLKPGYHGCIRGLRIVFRLLHTFIFSIAALDIVMPK